MVGIQNKFIYRNLLTLLVEPGSVIGLSVTVVTLALVPADVAIIIPFEDEVDSVFSKPVVPELLL